jgi:2,4-diaminopentanoate dehydrogenase
MTHKVFQWASGTVGRHTASAVLGRADCRLVGLHALTPVKVGRDIGELLGVEALGIPVTGDVESVLRSDADVVIHAPLASLVYGVHEQQDIDDICTLLEHGKNVITVVGYLHPKVHGTALVERIEGACRRGNSTFHSTGLNPGWMGDLLPLTMSALSRDIDRIVVREITNFEFYPSPEIMFAAMGFGSSVERFERDGERRRRWLNGLFAESIQLVADGIGLALDEIVDEREIATAAEPLKTAAGTIETGTVAGQHWTWTGRAGGADRIVHETVWRMHRSVAPEWPTGKHTVTIEGTPTISLALDGNWISDGLLATAMHAVNAIPHVCAAPPGIRTRLDLPGIYGRATR